MNRNIPGSFGSTTWGGVSHGMGDTKNAGVFFKESLKMCLSDAMGPTVRVMGLLPLSGLRRISAVKGLEVDAVENAYPNFGNESESEPFQAPS